MEDKMLQAREQLVSIVPIALDILVQAENLCRCSRAQPRLKMNVEYIQKSNNANSAWESRFCKEKCAAAELRVVAGLACAYTGFALTRQLDHAAKANTNST